MINPTITFTAADFKFAEQHGLTLDDLAAFKAEMLIEDELEREFILKKEREKMEESFSTMAVYPAW